MSASRAMLPRRGRTAFLHVLLCSALAACGDAPDPGGMPPLEVGTLEVRPSSLVLPLEYPAQLRGVREIEVRARVSGILLERLYREGSRVREGDLLFRIDPAPFRAEVARARAELEVQRANLQQAQREHERILSLYEQKLVSLRERDAAIAAYESAKAAVAAAEAALRRAELDLSYTEVRAPIGGLTSREARSEGSLVAAGTDSSLLTRIVQTDRLYVEFAMPERESASVRTALEGPDADSIHVRLTDARGTAIGEAARIEFMAPDVGDDTGTVAVRAVLDNPDGKLLPGQVVRARIEGVTLPGSFVIPKRAVMHGMQGTFVWVVDGEDKVAPRPVRLGVTNGNDVAVIEGLEAGERIVVDGILKVQPGVPVKPVPITQAAEGGAALATSDGSS